MPRSRSGSHIFQRGETWYYRRIVPAKYRAEFGQVVVAKSLNTTSETEAERLEKEHDVEFERRLRHARDATDPQAVGERVAEEIHLSRNAPDPYKRARRKLAETSVSDDVHKAAVEFMQRRLGERVAYRTGVQAVLAEIGGLLAPLAPEKLDQCRAGIMSVVQRYANPSMPAVVVDGVYTLEWGYDRWLRAGGDDRGTDVVKLARRHFDAFVAHCRLVMLADVRRSHVLAWRDSLVDAGEHKPKSINQRVQLVTAILRAGWRDAEMPQPDLKAITIPEPDDSGRGAWTRDEILKALNALEPLSWQAWLYLIGLTTATRLGEPVVAQRSWWNAKTGFIELRDCRLAKADKEHAMPIIECLRGPFAAYAERRDEGFLFDAPHPKDPDVPISNVASKAINRIFKKHGINRVFHELRDTWIEEARHSPVKREIWEIISGHSKATVSDRYGGEKPEVLAKANEDVCGFLTNDAEIKSAMLRLVS
jgi:hypothetical protein